MFWFWVAFSIIALFAQYFVCLRWGFEDVWSVINVSKTLETLDLRDEKLERWRCYRLRELSSSSIVDKDSRPVEVSEGKLNSSGSFQPLWLHVEVHDCLSVPVVTALSSPSSPALSWSCFEFQQLDSIDNAKPVWRGTGTQWEAFPKSNTEEKFYHSPDVTEKERQFVANRAGMKTRKFPRGEIESCGGP